MPAADELYLLSQKSSDLCADLINQFQKYFDWLDEVVLSAKESRGETIIPKTPARKRRNRKIVEDIENVPPSLPPPPQPVENNVRKSSRAAAKAAQEKTKKTIREISNIGVKIRRPSTPPQIEPEESKNIADTKNETVENSADFNKHIVIVELDIPETLDSEIDIIIEDSKKFEKIDEELCNPTECIKDDMDVKEAALNDNLSVEKLTDMTCQMLSDNNLPKVPSQDDVDKHEFSKPTRITRTKKRIVDTADKTNSTQSEEVLIRNTRSKRRKVEEITLEEDVMESGESLFKSEQSNSNKLTCKGILSDSQPVLLIPSKPIENEVSVCLPLQNVPQNNRITRSKVKKLSPKKSPTKEVIYYSPKQINPSKTNSQNVPRTPKAKIESPTFIQNSDSPQNRLKAKLNILKTSKTTRVHNTSIESNEMCSSPLVVKHIVNTNSKNGSSTLPRNKKSSQTPSPMSSSTAKMLGIKQSIFGSSGFQSNYAQKRKPIICASPQVGGKALCSTPTGGSRFQNIIMGPSFLTKVLPNKPTKEEIEEKKKEEIKRKQEREEEIRKKREEMLKWQREEKKRKNEERMRKVQESKQLKEKKEAEVREMLEKERKQREERLREERKRKLLEIKKMEELKSRKQAEEDRQREERRLLEEQRLIEEQKAREREELRKLEEKRKLQEKQEKILQEKREAERIAREKLELERRREEQRIAREKEEIERLKMKEALRLQQEKQLNETYTAKAENPLNATYSKPELNSTFQKSVVEVVINNANDYNIADLRSDESTDDELAPKKKIPSWALGKQLKNQLFDQEHYPPNLDGLFPPFVLLQMPDLSKIFPKCRSRFTKRTSSAVWNTPPYKVLSANR